MAGRPREFDEDDVLDRAIEVFWDQGFGATSMSDLVRATGLGRQSLYNAFGDKEGLFATALHRYREAALSRFVDRVTSPGADLTTLRGAFDDLAEAHARSGRGCLLLNTTMEAGAPLVGSLAASHLTDLANAFESTLSTARTDGQLRAEINPTSAANLLVALVAGLHVMGRAGLGKKSISDAVETAFEQLTGEF